MKTTPPSSKKQVHAKLKLIDHVIGAQIKDLRKKHGLNQVQFCKHIGLDQSALSRVESGRQQLTAAQWVCTSMLLGVPERMLGDLAREALG